MNKRLVISIFCMFLLAFTYGCLDNKESDPPMISMNIDGEKGYEEWYTSDVSISVNAIDNESKVETLQYRVNGGMWITYNINPITINRDGVHFVEIYTKDEHDNELTKNLTIKKDATKPTINLTEFEQGYVYWRGKKAPPLRLPRDTMVIGDYTFVANADDAVSGLKKIEFYLADSLIVEIYDQPFEWILQRTVGVYNVTAVSYDVAGNYNRYTVEEVQFFNFI